MTDYEYDRRLAEDIELAGGSDECEKQAAQASGGWTCSLKRGCERGVK